MPGEPAFLAGTSPAAATPLDRFLPPLPTGSAARWLSQHAAPGDWVLDPFGSAPAIVLEMARAGYRVLAAVNNPIVRFILEHLAQGPNEAALTASLAHLASSRVGEERLEPHLLALYHTPCSSCSTLVSADEFL